MLSISYYNDFKQPLSAFTNKNKVSNIGVESKWKNTYVLEAYLYNKPVWQYVKHIKI